MRVLLADDNTKVRSAVRLLLEQGSGEQVVGEAAEAETLLDLARTNYPDLVLVDWEMLGVRAPEYLSALRAHCPELMIVALSDQPQTR